MSYTTVLDPGTPRPNFSAITSSFRGVLTFVATSAHPAMSIELFIKDHPIPMRKPKFTEVSTVSQQSLNGGYETGFGGVFQGASEPLSVTIQGWIITPTSGGAWVPRTGFGSTGGIAATSFGNKPYTEIISGYLSGENNKSAGGAYNRLDPDQYITPYGQQYTKPIIYQWDCGLTSNMRKQTFSATLYLEH